MHAFHLAFWMIWGVHSETMVGSACMSQVEIGLQKEAFEGHVCCGGRFQLEPIAAASLGQVHLARIKGERVVVKVQRPFLKEIFDVDLRNIRVLAQILQVLQFCRHCDRYICCWLYWKKNAAHTAVHYPTG